MTTEIATFAGGCFWCTEAVFNDVIGVEKVESGYIGGSVDNPTYRQVCGGDTGHAEAIRITFDAEQLRYGDLLDMFFATHDPTTLNRQGNDVGTQYRSAIYTFDDAQHTVALASRDAYQALLHKAGYGVITTEIQPAPPFFYAEDDHQQYLAKNPGGYCGLGGTGVACPAGIQGVFIAS